MSDKQLDRLSEISGNLSLLFMGTVILPVLTNQQSVDTMWVLVGAIYSAIALLVSILLAKDK